MESKLLSTLEYLLSAFAGVAARVESLRGQMHSAFEPRRPKGRRCVKPCRSVEELFASLLSEAFIEHGWRYNLLCLRQFLFPILHLP